MKQTFTLEDLIRFMYRETNYNESFDIAKELAENFLLNEQFVELAEAKGHLPKVQFLPSKNSINHILEYSKKVSEHATV
jgi:hypothetical protein